MEDYAIKVTDVTKVYKLYSRNRDRVIDAFSLSRKPHYKEHFALNNLSFDVKKGETVGLIGTNGAGKSTILKIITGVLSQTSGTVEVNGRISALLELGAGFNPEFTGIENIYLNGTMIGFSKAEIDKKLDSILEFADIGDFVYQPVKTYSSGMFVRLAFAVAINIDPEILIVDEALSVGDVFFQSKCYKKFQDFKDMGKTIVFVSHDLGSISKYCDRVVLLNKGEKLKEGPPKEMIDIFKKLLVNQYDADEDKKPGIEQPKDDSLWKNQLKINPSLDDYGSKKCEMIDFGIFDSQGNVTNTIDKGEEFEIRIKARFNDVVKEPIFAYTIKDLKGTEVAGTNTMYEDVSLDPGANGDEVVISFKQKMDLKGGNYLLSLGCTGYENGEFTVYHRFYDIVDITVLSQKNIVGFFDMNSRIEYEKIK